MRGTDFLEEKERKSKEMELSESVIGFGGERVEQHLINMYNFAVEGKWGSKQK